MNGSSIARRYARALFELALEENRLAEVGQELQRVQATLVHDEVAALLADPALARDQKQRLVEALVQPYNLSATVTNTLRLLAERNRLAELAQVEEAYRALADERAGRLKARVVSAVPLAEEQARVLRERLAAATGAEVVLERAVDPSILGGAIAQVGSKVYDGSLRTQLEQLRKQLLS